MSMVKENRLYINATVRVLTPVGFCQVSNSKDCATMRTLWINHYIHGFATFWT